MRCFSACNAIGHLPGSSDLHVTKDNVRWTRLARFGKEHVSVGWQLIIAVLYSLTQIQAQVLSLCEQQQLQQQVHNDQSARGSHTPDLRQAVLFSLLRDRRSPWVP